MNLSLSIQMVVFVALRNSPSRSKMVRPGLPGSRRRPLSVLLSACFQMQRSPRCLPLKRRTKSN